MTVYPEAWITAGAEAAHRALDAADPRLMRRLDLELEVTALRAEVRDWRRQAAIRDGEQARIDGTACPRCGGPDPLAPWDVCGPCADVYGWAHQVPAVKVAP
jgi:hypothetical protein